ncbi:MAG TPA: VWA domain-containing protein [Candidatus Acidoferrales bacterium]|nr:VWA domain-containing protein [Candidatus Acidoferrales bacterium]
MHRYMRLVLVSALLASAAPLFAQEVPCPHRTLSVNVLDDKGLLFTGLTPVDFKASVGKQSIKVVSVKPNAAPPRVMIILDVSRSMIENKLDWDYDVRAARTVLQDLPKNASVGLALFSAKIKLNIPPTQDRQELVAELNRLNAGERAFPSGARKTALWDALDAVASDFDPPRVGDSMYVLTDSGDNVSIIHANAVK